MPREGDGIQTAGFTLGWATGFAAGCGAGVTVLGTLRSAFVSCATAGAAPTARTATAIAMLLPRTIPTPNAENAYGVIIGDGDDRLEPADVMSL